MKEDRGQVEDGEDKAAGQEDRDQQKGAVMLAKFYMKGTVSRDGRGMLVAIHI